MESGKRYTTLEVVQFKYAYHAGEAGGEDKRVWAGTNDLDEVKLWWLRGWGHGTVPIWTHDPEDDGSVYHPLAIDWSTDEGSSESE